MIRLGSLAGYPFEGPRLLAGWTPPAVPAVYAIAYKPAPGEHAEQYAVIYVGHSDDLTKERFPFQHPRASCWVKRAGDRYKIYILDEAHQITEAAFNALLKTLEEPPAHVIFMMATTQPEDIPQTIRSRCQHFSFHAVKFDDILAQLKMIAAHEEVTAEDAALALLAEAGDGSMRDALSIMDQAIASAPTENGRPALSAGQIRDLMGSVPNAVFERLMEAVAAGQSAELMEQLNLLVNAGHSPSSLARQMVRYLRNALMAKLGGEQTELLQISGDERARAARTAQLFSEEELTRNLQTVLRTFDDLNYRQEQRFHLELGLLKLIHAQRLLPMEELLSGMAAGGGVRSGPAAPVSRPPATGPRSAPVAASRPAATPLSPFGAADSGWGSAPTPRQSASRAPVAEMEAGAGLHAAAPFTPVASPASGFAAGESLTEGALARLPEEVAAAHGDDILAGLAAEPRRVPGDHMPADQAVPAQRAESAPEQPARGAR